MRVRPDLIVFAMSPFVFAAAVLLPCAADATTIAVTTTSDELNTDGDCSLREAVRSANTNVAVDACAAGQNEQTDTITVPAGTYTLTLAGNDNTAAAGDLDLLDNAAVDDLVISGVGAATTIIQACSVEQLAAVCPSGQGIVDRVLNVFDAHVAISGVTIRHGRASAGSGIWLQRFNTGAEVTLTDVVVTKNGDSTNASNTYGGGIVNWNGALTLTRTTVSDNWATSAAGISNSFDGTVLVLNDSTVSGNTAFGNAGGISNDENAVLTCIDSTISGNHVGGGPIYNQYSNSGGGLYNFRATATLTGCTVSDNVAQARAGGIMNWTTHPSLPATMTLTDSTISGNHSETAGPAAFWNETATATLTNCTISGNQAEGIAGGIYTTNGMMDIRSTTITANRLLVTPHGAGGIWAAGPMVLRNTIIAGNFDETIQTPAASDCFSGYSASPVSEGYSLVADGYYCPGLVDGANGDRIGTPAAPIDAKLGPLADYGGPTFTHALMSGSPAIDGGNPAAPGSGGTACPATDQRGETRPGGAACDIGALESVGGGAVAATSVQPTSGGTAGTVQLRVYGEGFVPGAVVRLVRAGSADVVGGATGVLGTVVTASFDLQNVAAGTWSVQVGNPGAAVATLADAFTVVAGGEPDLWVDVQTPIGFQTGRLQSIYVVVGNRGSVDAFGVPLWMAFGEPLQWFVPFVVSPPPVQPGQIATDWSRIGIDLAQPTPSPELPEKADTFHFLVPIVPAGSTNTFRIRVRSPLSIDPPAAGGQAVINVATSIGDPYFQPDLSADVVAFYVSQAKGYATRAHGTTTFPDDAAIEAYVRTQLTTLVADGRTAAVGNASESLPIYSQVQLIIDAGQFVAGVGATAQATSADRSWLARIVAEFVGRSAEAYDVGDPDRCKGGSKDLVSIYRDLIRCENENDRCAETGCDDDGLDVDPDPCGGDAQKFVAKFLGITCKPSPKKPKPKPVPFQMAHDPNYKAGPGEPGGLVDGVTPLTYTVTYENVATASGDAFEVTVTDQLDVAKYDLDTFNLGPISFGNRFVPVPPGLKSFSTEVDMRPAVDILVGIDAGLDVGTGIVTWKFQTRDPATHQFPEDPVHGFLPPNVTSPQGEGEMLFTVNPKPGLALTTSICNDASIVFDFNPPIVTNEFCNTIGSPVDSETDCGNCIDDDGNGLTDFEDPACCTGSGPALSLQRGLMKPSKSGSQLLLKGALAGTLPDATATGLAVQLRSPANGELLCARIAAAGLRRKGKAAVFTDKKGQVAGAGGLASVVLKARKKGPAALTVAAKKATLATPAPGPTTITLGFGDGAAPAQCAAVTPTFRAKKKGAVVAP